MEIRLHEALLNLAAAAIEQGRPETFGAYTVGLKDSVPTPWSHNKPGDSIQLNANQSEVNFDARGSSVQFKMTHGDLAVSLRLTTALHRRQKSKEERADFAEPVVLGGTFGNAHPSGGYPLILERLVISKLEPVGVRSLLSWLLSSSLTRSISDMRLPSTIELIDGVLYVKLGTPAIEPGLIRIGASLEEKP